MVPVSLALRSHQNLHHHRSLVFLSLLQNPQNHLLNFRMHSIFADHFPLTVVPTQIHRIHYQILLAIPRRPPIADLLELVSLNRILRSLPLHFKHSHNANLPILLMVSLAQIIRQSDRNHHPLSSYLIPWHLPERPRPTQGSRCLHHANFNFHRHFPTSLLMFIVKGLIPENYRSYYPQIALIILLLRFRWYAATSDFRRPNYLLLIDLQFLNQDSHLLCPLLGLLMIKLSFNLRVARL